MNSNISIEIPVKIGSNSFKINLNEYQKSVSSRQFVQMALEKCKIKCSPSSYAVFEDFKGIERLLNEKENIIALWQQWRKEKNFEKLNVRLVIRKICKVEKKILNKDLPLNDTIKIKSCYRKNKIINGEVTSASKKRMSNGSALNNSKRSKIIEVVEEKQPVKRSASDAKMCQYKKEQLETQIDEKMTHNVNFLQFLYYKLREQNIKNRNYRHLNNESMNKSGSQNSSTRTSTSSLESLL